eukprot:1143607-Pleurochrysis_carterae.AAC.5
MTSLATQLRYCCSVCWCIASRLLHHATIKPAARARSSAGQRSAPYRTGRHDKAVSIACQPGVPSIVPRSAAPRTVRPLERDPFRP